MAPRCQQNVHFWQFNSLLFFGLIAQLVEHCISIAEVTVRVPFRPEFTSLTRYCLSSAKSYDNRTLKIHFDP